MSIQKLLIAVLIVLSVVFMGFQIYELEVEAAGIRALMLILLTALYYIRVKNRRLFFFLFLITFAIAEILNFIGWLVPIVPIDDLDYMYFIGNSLYILSYSFLIVRILSSMNLLEIVRKLPFHLLILIVLDVFCVIVVTNTAMDRLNYYEYLVELVYNSVIMILLTVALINYILKNDKKAINLLIGSIFIFFSEIIQLAYFYVSNINLLNVFCSLFLVLAFVFFYLQSRLSYEPQEDSLYGDLLV
ncbi:hypothetical protein M8845_08495 [Gelidibacter japonicus]|uniref:hypothetical protein n=1 Tax=Gelidibacter japonicus TaxID=1962232 RepID=UPI002021C57F|nr:hypothetical protein [Gelidibacter japonicus]MCL8007464.1 hypothetical protein [Gelidibacter japonicus]